MYIYKGGIPKIGMLCARELMEGGVRIGISKSMERPERHKDTASTTPDRNRESPRPCQHMSVVDYLES